MLTRAQVAATVERIAELQRPDGMVPWYLGGHADPWNHVEAAMALTVGGRRREAQLAYRWLAGAQAPDGSWSNYYRNGASVDRRRDTNVCAYVATGTWQHYLTTADRGFLEAMSPTVEAAVGFVLGLQQPGGEVLWCVEPDGSAGRYALLTASSSIYFSLRCAVATTETLGRPRPEWELAAGRLAHAIAHRPHAFEPKHRFAMDWYYPVLCGAVGGEPARARLREGWPTFVMDGLGVRCVSDRPWVTSAETAECSLALAACGLYEEAELLLTWAQRLRRVDGSYWTGCVYPQTVHFPCDEHSTYSSAAVVLAHHTLFGEGAAARLFRGHDLPRGLVVPAGPLTASDAGAHPAQHP
ncbi:MAG: prenyltransferase [Actinomycetota bacterium]|nr:prenyltransferase [Actinomycetota bacterium]